MKKKNFPVFSLLVLGVIILGCLFGKVLATGDPFYMNLTEVSLPPGSAHYFGTDTMGRDIYSMIWEGGRVSLYIGILATAISSVTAIVYGCVSGLVPDWLDDLLMRFTEIILSIPSILLVIFLQALLGEATATSIAVVIGLTSWMNISKVVRSEVRQIRNSDFVLASRLAGGKFFYILRKHLFPNFISSTMFMIVTNVSAAIGTEATFCLLYTSFNVLPFELILNFMRENPHIRVEWNEYSNEEVKSMLEDSRLEYGFIVGKHEGDDMIQRKLDGREILLLVFEGHPLYEKESVNVEMLREENMILMNEHFHMYHDFASICCAKGFTPNIIAKTSDGAVLYKLCRQKIGLAVIPEFMLEDFRMEHMRAIPFEEHMTWEVFGVYKEDTKNYETIQQFDCFLKQKVST